MGIAKRIIRYRINSWFLSSQLGTVGHTVRDRSQERWGNKPRKYRYLCGGYWIGSFSVKNDVGEGSYVDLTKARSEMAEFRQV